MGLMEFIVEKCPSNKTSCCKCDKHIDKDAMRMVQKKEGFKFPTKTYECAECGARSLEFQRGIMENQIKILNGVTEFEDAGIDGGEKDDEAEI